MPSADSSQPPFHKSSYPELKVPAKWESSIPEHLLADTDPATRWIMEELSKNTKAIEWACHGLVDTNTQVRNTNGRLLKAEADIRRDKDSLTALVAKADLMEPLFKPLSLFMRLWDYKWFRILCYFAGLFILMVVVPWYIQHPLSIDAVWSFFFGP
jgi:hypothetical protein